MKVTQQLSVSAIILGVAIFGATSFAKPVKKHGTDILHFFVRKAMTTENVEAGAAGNVDAKQNQQGNANNERLKINVSGLTTNTEYQLMAVAGDDTNLVSVAQFSTDASGKAALDYNKNGNGKALGKKTALPALLDPLSNIRVIGIYNGSTQAVLMADLTMPDKLQYLIKRDISSGEVSGDLRIKATTSQTQFRLVASGLFPTNDYSLVLNGSVAETHTADDQGRLTISSLLQNPMDILDLHTLELWDSVSNVVLATELP